MNFQQGCHLPKPLRPYWIKHYYHQVQLVTNHEGSWDETAGSTMEKGWATFAGGWLIKTAEFKRYHPRACLFSRLEVGPKGMVRAWIYDPNIHAFFKEATDRDLFMCWVDPDCLYEMFVV